MSTVKNVKLFILLWRLEKCIWLFDVGLGKDGGEVGGVGIRILYHNIFTHPWLTLTRQSYYIAENTVKCVCVGGGGGVKILYHNILTRPWITTQAVQKGRWKKMCNRSIYNEELKNALSWNDIPFDFLMWCGLRRWWGREGEVVKIFILVIDYDCLVRVMGGSIYYGIIFWPFPPSYPI